MDKSTRHVVRKFAIDVCILLAVGIPILLFFCFGKPFERGYFCDDESLKHPYHESTVPSYMLVVVGLGVPGIVMLLTEYVLVRNVQNIYKDKPLKLGNFNIPLWFVNFYNVIAVFGFGAMCSQLLTDVMKYSIGRLRPHFFAVCRPQVECTEPYQYIENFTCSNDAEGKLLKEMRLSFPSGHSSFSMYCMFYFAMYVQARWTWRGSMLAKHLVQYLSVMAAVYTGMSRVSDYKHHWSDVLTGLLLGVFLAVLVARFASNLFPKKETVLPLTNENLEAELSSRNTNGRTTST